MKVIITISSQKGSPDVFFPKERMKDIEAIFRVIQEANTFIYISVPNYLPILKRTQPNKNLPMISLQVGPLHKETISFWVLEDSTSDISLGALVAAPPT
ncbi:hypothetical protein E1301_Tti021133 [Triplophysa tibetana]|uniref:PLD-like domain-containing protein n=1 Tax=Triplophysa tibetana TaxID=1572043 RepID=A0A5A9P9M7_9TELE|nr:hypothetical protein E1301_Tti021133 [Triplophysa tibetana]